MVAEKSPLAVMETKMGISVRASTFLFTFLLRAANYVTHYRGVSIATFGGRDKN